MERWKSYTQAGNAAFEAGELEAAEGHYQQARERAEKLLDLWLVPAEAVAALVVSYHNLADLYFRQGRDQAAVSSLQTVHQMLMRRLRSTDTDPARREALMQGVNRTYPELLQAQRRLGLPRRPDRQALNAGPDQPTPRKDVLA